MPVDGKALSYQAVGDLNDDSVALVSGDGRTRGHAIDSNG